jgi:hypothetical protein
MQEEKRLMDINVKIEPKRKFIIIEDSFMKMIGGINDKTSRILDPRNPLMKDETIIDYDMSSEEEWNE